LTLSTDEADASETQDAPSPGRERTGLGIVGFLSDGIRSGRYAPGQRLVEADLTAELGVSRGPVREALRRLAAEGLVELIPHRGAVVRRLSARDALELFEIRTELEAMAARRAAGRMTDRHVRQRFENDIAAIWDEAPRQSTADYIAENQHFHGAVIRAAGNLQLVDLNWRLQLTLILSQVRVVLTSEVVDASLREHRVIARALLDCDASAAEAAIREHLGRATAVMAAAPAALFRPEG
jgi:DNA-binding GntR family transcriptional regulator